MDNARWEQIKSIFSAAMDHPAAERSAFLDRACASDVDLRHEVESLLNKRTQDVIRTGGAAHAIAESATATSPFAPITERPGSVIGQYKLLQQIGEGGFGTVFLAEQSKPVRRRVALKIIKLGMDTKSVIARFEAERQALALMEHPHIARVLDAGATDTGRPYFVMEYVIGDSITHFADAHKLNVRQRLELFSQVCQAVQHAHTKGVIHRDIKPGNILVSMSDGKPFAKVIDFGIAKATAAPLTDKTLFTEHRQLIGTPEYMSPEQAEGSADIDTRTDVYALGVLLYELLTGLTPFDGARLRSAAWIEMQRIIREEDPPAPSIRLTRDLNKLAATAAARHLEPNALSTQIKGELDWIVMKAMDKDRARRYESPSQLAADVGRHLLGEAVDAAPASPGYRLRKFVRRNKSAVGASAAIAIVLLLGIVGTSSGFYEANRRARGEAIAKQEAQNKQKHAELKTVEAEAAKAAELKAREDSESASYIANIQMAELAMRYKEFGVMETCLNACVERLRGWEWRWLHAYTDNSIASFGGPKESIKALRPSPDGKRVATSSMGSVQIREPATGTVRLTLPAPQGSTVRKTLAWSPDGSRVAAELSEGRIALWDTGSGAIMRVFEGHPGTSEVESIVFSPSGQVLLTGSAYSGTGVRLWNIATGQMLLELQKDKDESVPEHLQFSLNGTMVLGIIHDQCIIWSTETGARLRTIDSCRNAKFSPDGVHILTTSGNNLAEIRRVADGEIERVLKGHEEAVLCLAFSPDGKWIVTGSRDDTARVWDAATGDQFPSLRGHESWISEVAFSSDGLWIATSSADGTARMWAVDGLDCVSEMRGAPRGLALDTQFSSDFNYVFCLDYNGMCIVWDGSDGPQPVLETDFSQSSLVRLNDAGTEAFLKYYYGVAVVDVQTGETLRQWTSEKHIVAADFSSDGTMCAVMQYEGVPLVIDLRTGTQPVTLDHEKVSAYSGDIALSRNGKWIVTAGAVEGGRARAWVWDAATGRRMCEMVLHNNAICDIRLLLSPDSERLVTWMENTGSNEARRIWRLPEGTEMTLGDDKVVQSAQFSNDGSKIVGLVRDGHIQSWDSHSGEPLFKAPVGGSDDAALAMSRDGQFLAQVSSGELFVWDIKSGSLMGSNSYFWQGQVSFSPDGTRMLVSSEGAHSQLLDARTGSALVSFQAESYAGPAVFCEDGNRIVQCYNGTLVIHDSRPYRERRADLNARFKAGEEMHAKVEARFVAGEEPNSIAASLDPDLIADDNHRRALLAATESLRKHGTDTLYKAVWKAIDTVPVSPQNAASAVAMARRAAAMEPEKAYLVGTLGVALYRASEFREAHESLTRSDAMNIKSKAGPQPVDRAFLAMTHWKLGHKTEARATLASLQELATQEKWKNDAETAEWLKEAQDLIDQPKPSSLSDPKTVPAK